MSHRIHHILPAAMIALATLALLATTPPLAAGFWQQVEADIDGEAAVDWYGRSVSLSADGNAVAIVAVGNDGTDTDAGHVRILIGAQNQIPDFSVLQLHLAAAPLGVGARDAWGTPGARGEHVTIADIEFATWNLSHIELAGQRVQYLPNGSGLPFDFDDDHGTAVVGLMVAADNGFGTTGIVPDAGLVVIPHLTDPPNDYIAGIRDAIDLAVATLQAGDVVLLEANIGTPLSVLPVEWDQGIYQAIVRATNAGLIVLETAGNTPTDLDANPPQFAGWGDSGAIIVGAGQSPGAGTGTPRAAHPWSVYGTRVDLQGYGDHVTTTGRGDLRGQDAPCRSGIAANHNSPGSPACGNDSYTALFSGTSSATPIVAGVAAAISSVAQERGMLLTSRQIRSLLIETGTPQDTTSPGTLLNKIGPLPNLPAALDVLTMRQPRAVADSVVIVNQTTAELDVLANDHDPAGWLDPRTLNVIGSPPVTVEVEAGRLRVTAGALSGLSRFIYEVCLANGTGCTQGFVEVDFVDTIAPTWALPDDLRVEATSPDGAIAVYQPAASDEFGVVSAICTPPPGSLFPLGTTGVTCSASDHSGNVGSASFALHVVDTVAPIWSVPPGLEVPAESLSGASVTFVATASDAVGVAESSCSPETGSTFAVGSTTVECTASDAAGNIGAATFEVLVFVDASSIGVVAAGIEALGLPRGVARSLQAPLQQAERLALDGNVPNDAGACNQIGAFLRQVQGYVRHGELDPNEAESLNRFGHALELALNCVERAASGPDDFAP